LQKSPDWSYLDKYCSQLISAKTRSLLNGNAKTIEDYRAEAGFVAGALFVLQAGEQVEQKLAMQMQLEAEYKAAEAV
jgi:hypothetical protein